MLRRCLAVLGVAVLGPAVLGLAVAGILAVPGVLVAASAAAAASPTTLDAVRASGKLACGVVLDPEDWTKTDLHGGLEPLDLEICKAVAVAALGEAAKVEVHPYNSELEAGAGLQKGEVALVLGMTPTATAQWQFGIGFGPPVFYDGQSVLVRGDAKVSKLSDLAGLRVCFIQETLNDHVFSARIGAQKITLVPMPFQEEGEMDDALVARHCDAVSAYVSKLTVMRVEYPEQLAKDYILPDWLTIAPVAPAFRAGDQQWAMIVDWTINALIQAEASGVTQANVGEMRDSEDPVVKQLLGTDWAAAQALGLQDHFWASKVISVVGNYGEIYDRTVGMHSRLQLPRGRNALWSDGGLMHPSPVQ